MDTNQNLVKPFDDSSYKIIADDVNLMFEYATRQGLTLPTSLSLMHDSTNNKIIEDYNTLTNIVKPANVASIKYIKGFILENGNVKKWYQIPALTKCMLIACVALLLLIAVSLLPIVNEVNQSKSLLASSGWPLFFNLIFICSASLLGVMFYLLKTMLDKIKNNTLMPADSIGINSTILIGIISGFIISELFTISFSSFSDSIEIQKMSLALLGGFASDVIFSVLKGIVNKLKAITGGGSD